MTNHDIATVWNSLEIAKLLVAFLAPISVVVIGLVINRRLKDIDHHQWINQKAIETRIGIFESIAPDLNRLYCFYFWRGDWQNINPDEILKIKRNLDSKIHIHRFLIGDEVYKAYQEFIHLLFKTFTGPGKNALIKSTIISNNGDRRKLNYNWDKKWDDYFDEIGTPDFQVINNSYMQLMQKFRISIGL